MHNDNGNIKTSLVALVAAYTTIYFVWGSTYLAIRVGVTTIPPLTMAGVRFLVAGVILLAFVKLRGISLGGWQQWRDNAIIGAILLLGGNGLIVWAEQFVPSGVTALLIAFEPISVVIVEWIFTHGKRPNLLTSIGLATGLVGTVILIAPWEEFSGSAEIPLKGTLAVLLSTVFWAVGSIFSRYVREPAPAFSASTIQMLCGGALLTGAAAIRGEFANIQPETISVSSWFSLIYLITIGSLVAYSAYTWLLTHSSPVRVSTYAYVNPIVAVFLGWLILDEAVTLRTSVAAAIIVLSVVLIISSKKKKPRLST